MRPGEGLTTDGSSSLSGFVYPVVRRAQVWRRGWSRPTRHARRHTRGCCGPEPDVAGRDLAQLPPPGTNPDPARHVRTSQASSTASLTLWPMSVTAMQRLPHYGGQLYQEQRERADEPEQTQRDRQILPHVNLLSISCNDTLMSCCDASRPAGRVGCVPELSHDDYANLLRFRTALRRFDSWSHEQARRVGLTHAQHQLLLAVKGHADPDGPTIREAAEYLNTRHHSVVERVDRAERAGLLRRARDDQDGRVVRLRLSDLGEERIAQLTELHLLELSRLAPVLQHLLTSDPAEPRD